MILDIPSSSLIWTILGTGFTFLMTVLGSAVIFLMKKENNANIQKTFLGFAAGIMIAASVWSLLIPAIDQAEANGQIGWIPAAGGFILGGLFLFLLDNILPHLHPVKNLKEGLSSNFKRTTLLVSAVTIHNIPEGMAVGLSFALAAQNASEASVSAAMALAIGIGIQNFPEGAAVSLPMLKEGLSKNKAFLIGALSGIVEPIFGILTVLVSGSIVGIMPWLLAFAAGAMIYVVVEELIPEANLGEHSHNGTIGVMLGFLIMMVLDVALG